MEISGFSATAFGVGRNLMAALYYNAVMPPASALRIFWRILTTNEKGLSQ